MLKQRHHMLMPDLGKLGRQLRKLLEDVVPHGEGWVGQHLYACMRARWWLDFTRILLSVLWSVLDYAQNECPFLSNAYRYYYGLIMDSYQTCKEPTVK